mmetsp:Transcript_70093/g.116415  ORF Transcript_70093/g.116415 Transcript_70093/m.116415 type:complete len:207 (+) Transcript_70093:921-1541(+)
MRQIEVGCIYRKEEVHDRTMARQLAERLLPIAHALRQLGCIAAVGEHTNRVERGSVRYDSLLSFDDLAVLELNANTTLCLLVIQELVHMRVKREDSSPLLKTSLKRVRHLDGAAQWHAEGTPILEEALENVQNMRGHRPFGREATKDTHGVDIVAQEGHSDNLVNCLVKRVESQRQVEEDIRVRQYVGRCPRRRCQHASVLPEVDE